MFRCEHPEIAVVSILWHWHESSSDSDCQVHLLDVRSDKIRDLVVHKLESVAFN